jgi:pimeloyl-ACP methyl ester carboxylesterase
VLVGHSYGGGVALSAARLAPGRVEALVLLASVGPGCLTGWDRLLAAPVAGEVCAVAAWWLTPWLARARLAAIARLRRRPIVADEHVNWHIWGHAHHDHGPLWRSFLTEQRALVRELGDLAASLPHVVQPVLLVADLHDTLPGQDHPSAGGGPARRPRPACEPDRPRPSPPWGARHRGRDRCVPGRPGQPACISLNPQRSRVARHRLRGKAARGGCRWCCTRATSTQLAGS